MDFKLILLLVGLGLLLMIAIFALIGFFSGLKKELKCTAIALILLIIALLVFGNSSTLLNANGEFLKNILGGIPASAHTVWECVLGFARSAVENGDKIFAEGTESYTFLYNVVSCIARGAMLLIGVFAVLIVILLVNAIYRIVSAIHNKKHKKEVEGPQDQSNCDNVVVGQDTKGDRKGAVVVVEPSKEEARPQKKRRGWGALLAAVRAFIIVLILFMPISGICSVLNEVTPETEQLVKDVLNGNVNKTAKQSQTDQMVDMAMDFRDAYADSMIGHIVEAPQYFFGESISAKLFDSSFVVKSDNGNYPLRGEVVTLLRAVNALNGNIDTKNLPQEDVNNALDALKDSKLIVDVLPVAIEFAYYTPIKDDTFFKGQTLGDLLFKANQQAAFLALRQEDWKANLSAILDAAKEAYALGVFKSDFNYLTMDTETLRKAADKITDATAVNKLFNILLLTALNHEQFTKFLGSDLPNNPDLSKFDWKQELDDIVDIYDVFKTLGITTLKDVNMNDLVTDLLNNQFDTVADIASRATDLQLFKDVLSQVAIIYVSNQKLVKDAGIDLVQQVRDLAKVDWHSDIVKYLEALKIALNKDIVTLDQGLHIEVDYFHLDPDALREVLDKAFTTESFEKILPIATTIVINTDAFKKFVGDNDMEINTKDIKWQEDLNTLVDIYEEFLEFGVNEITDITDNVMGFAKGILADDNKKVALENIVDKLTDLSLFYPVIVPVGNAVLGNLLEEKVPPLAPYIDLTAASEQEIKEDLNNLVKVVENVYDITEFNFNVKELLGDLTFDDALADKINDSLERLFELNVLGDNENITNIVNALLAHFHPFGEEHVVELENIDWDSELDVIQELVRQAVEIVNYEGIDLEEMKFDYEKLLTNEEFLDKVVSVLENVVESEVVLQLLPTIIDVYVIPRLQDLDDDGVVKDITSSLTSEELINEVTKLVDVLKALIKIGVLKYNTEGLNAIKFEETEAFHTVINGILDSKLIEGFEGRIIRLILVATKILPDLEKGVFDGIDWDREQDILNTVVDDLEVLMKDERFVVVVDGKFQLYSDFYFTDEAIAAYKSALDHLFGSWDLDGTETLGSQLIEKALPLIVDKFLDKVPEKFQELVEILDVDNATGENLASDVRHVMFILKRLADMNAQEYLTNKDYDFSYAADGVSDILDAIFDMHLLQGKLNELAAWGVGLAIDTAKLDVEKPTASSFENVDWNLEKEYLKDIIRDVISLARDNNLNTITKVSDFVKNKGYKNNAYYTSYNANLVLNIAEDLARLQTVETMLKPLLEFGLKTLDNKGFDFKFLGDNMTGELLAEDLKSVIDMARIAVNRLDIVKIYRNNQGKKLEEWEADLPEIEPVLAILDLVMELNLLDGRVGQVLEVLANKLIKQNNYLNASDLDFSNFNVDTEWPVLRKGIAILYSLLPANNLETISEVMTFIKNKDYTNINLVRDENILIIADALEVLADSDLVEQAFVAVINNLVKLDMVTKYGDFDVFDSYTKEYAKHDIAKLADIARAAVAAGAANLAGPNRNDAELKYTELGEVVRMLPELILVKDYFSLILPGILNYVSNNVLTNIEINHTFTSDDFGEVDWVNEFDIIADAVVLFGDIALEHNLDSIRDLMNFFKNSDFMNPMFLTEPTAYRLLDIADVVLESKLVEVLCNFGADILINVVSNMGYNITFLDGIYTGSMLYEDAKVLVSMAREAIEFGAIEYYQTKDIEKMEVVYVQHIAAKLEDLNILTAGDVQPHWAAFVANFIAQTLGLQNKVKIVKNAIKESEFVFKAADFEGINFSNENALLVEAIGLVGELFANENIVKFSDIDRFIKSKFYTEYNTFNDPALDNIQALVNDLGTSKFVSVLLPMFVHYGVNKFTMLDLSFLKGQLTGAELSKDVLTLNKMITSAREFGVVDFIFKDYKTADINFDPIIDIAALLEELNILTKNDLNREWSALAFNFVNSKTLKLDQEFKASDFKEINFANENALLVSGLEYLADLSEVTSIKSYADVIDFINNKTYLDKDFYTLDVEYDLKNIAYCACDSGLVQVVLPIGFDKAIDFAMNKTGMDLAFLKGSLTGAQLGNDLRVLIDDALFLIHNKDIIDTLSDVINKAEDIRLPEYLPSYLSYIVNSFKDLNVLHVDQARLTSVLTNYVAEKVIKYTGRVTPADFANVSDWDAEMEVIRDILSEVQGLFSGYFKEHDLSTVKAFQSFIGDVQKDLTLISDDLVSRVGKILTTASNSMLIADLGVFGEQILVSYLEQKDIMDLAAYMVYDPVDLSKDLRTLGSFLEALIDVNGIGFGLRKEALVQDKVSDFGAAFASLLKLNTISQSGVREEVVSFLFNKFVKLETTPADFHDIDWSVEAQVIADTFVPLESLLKDFNLDTIEGMKKFFTEKEYLNRDLYNLDVEYDIRLLADTVLDSQLLMFYLPYGFDKLVDIAVDKTGMDLAFLKGQLTGNEIADDIRVLVDDLVYVIHNNEILDVLSDVINKAEDIRLPEFLPSYLSYIVNSFKELNVLHIDQAKITAVLTNFVADKVLKFNGTVTPDDFANITDWDAEMDYVRNVLADVQKIYSEFFIVNDANSVKTIPTFIQKVMKDYSLISDEVVLDVAELLKEMSSSRLICDEAAFGERYLVSFLRQKQDVDLTPYAVYNPDDIAQDLFTLGNFLDSVVRVNLVGFAARSEVLDQNYVVDFATSLGELVLLHTLDHEGMKEELISWALNKFLKVEVSASELAGIDWDSEAIIITALVIEANQLTLDSNKLTLAEIKNLVTNKDALIAEVKPNERTMAYSETISNILGYASFSGLVNKLALPLSEKYLTDEKLAGYADLHNIYPNGDLFSDDLLSLSFVIRNLGSLDLYNVWTTREKDIPYGETDAVHNIINVLKLNYFNLPGRVDTLLDKLGAKFNVDLSDVDGSLIDLASDADGLFNVYMNLTTFTLDDNFWLKNFNDLKNMRIVIKDWSAIQYRLALKTAVHNLINTTIVKETRGAIFLIALVPYLQKNFGDIYDALDIENYTASEFGDDFDSLVAVFDDLMDTDIEAVLDGEYFSSAVEKLLATTIETVRNLNLVADHGNALADAILARYDGKYLNGYKIVKDNYDLASIDFYHDGGVLVDIVHTVFAFLKDHDILTMDDLKAYRSELNTVRKALDEVLENLDDVDELLVELLDLTSLEHNALPIYNLLARNQIVKFDANLETLADLDSVYASSSELHADLVLLRAAVRNAIDFGIVDIMNNGATINYDQEALVHEFLDNLGQIKFLNERIGEIVDYLDIKVSQDLSVLDAHSIEWAHDMAVLKEVYSALIPALVDYRNPLSNREDVENLLSKNITIQKGFIYDYEYEYGEAIKLLADISIAPQIVKFAADRFGSGLKDLARDVFDVLDIANADNDDLREDIKTLGLAFQDAIPMGLVARYLEKKPVSISDHDAVKAVVTDVFALHLVDDHMKELFVLLYEKLVNVDLSAVDFSTVDFEAEQAQLIEALNPALDVLDSLDITTLNGVKEYFKDTIEDVKADVKEAVEQLKARSYKEALKTLVNSLRDVLDGMDTEALVKSIEELTKLEMVIKVIIPTYDQRIFSRLEGIRATIGDIHDYNEDNLRGDLDLLSGALKDIKRSGIYSVLKDKTLDKDPAKVAALQDAVRKLCQLDLIDVKLQDAGTIGQYVLDRTGLTNALSRYVTVDLTRYDFTAIDFELDSEQYAQMVPPLYDVIEGYINVGLKAALFGETDAVRGLVEIYELSLDTTLGDLAYPKFVNLATRILEKLHITVNSDTDTVLHSLATMMYGLCDLGFFSNNGIEFDNTAKVEAIRDALYDAVTLPSKLRRFVNAVVARVDAYGTVPFDWRLVNVRTELRALRAVLRDIRSIPTSGGLRGLLGNASFQNAMTNVFRDLMPSSIFSQLFFPMMEGTFRAFTRAHYDGVMEYSATLDDILNYVLPDVWAVGNELNNLPESLTSLEFDEAGYRAVARIVDVLFSDILVKDNLDAILANAIGRWGTVEVDDALRADIATIDFASDKVHLINAFNALADRYASEPFELKLASTSSATFYAFKDLLNEVKETDLMKKSGLGLFSIVVNKVLRNSNADFAEELLFRIEDGSYTNEYFNEDLTGLVNLFQAIGASGMFEHPEDYFVWNYEESRTVIHELFNLHLLETRQDELINTIFEKVPFVKENYDPDTMEVTNWEYEFTAIINTLEQVKLAGLDTIDFPVDDLGGKGGIINAAMGSVILKGTFVKKFNSNLALNGLDSYTITVDDVEHVSGEAGWNAEIDCLQRAQALVADIKSGNLDMSNPSSFAQVQDEYKYIHENSYIADKCFTAGLEDQDIEIALLDYTYRFSTTANNNFATKATTDMFLYSAAAAKAGLDHSLPEYVGANSTTSYRIGLTMNADHTFQVVAIANPGDVLDLDSCDVVIEINTAYNDYSDETLAAIRTNLTVGKRALILGNQETGHCTISLYL